MIQQTPQKRVTFKRTLRTLTLGVLSIATILYGGFAFHSQKTYAATSSTVNFQARLEGPGGNIIADGLYNIQFKMYDVSSGGAALWTESYYDANGVTAGQDNRVQVTNGYVSVQLGSQTALSGVNWDQNTWVTMNIGGTNQTATPTYDGEMAPRLALTAVPYAFRAGQLATGNGTLTSTLSLIQPTVGNQNFQIADQGAAGTYQICVQGSTSGCNAASGSGFYIQNQNASAQTTSNFWISGTGRADTSILTPTLDTATAGTLSVGTGASSTAITLGQANTILTIPSILAINGTQTGYAGSSRVTLNGTFGSNVTTAQYGFQNQVNFVPTGGSLSSIYGLSNVAVAAGSSYNINQLYGAVSGVNTNGGYTGQIGTGAAFVANEPTIGGTKTTYNISTGFMANANTTNTGNTTGTVSNYQFRALANTAAAGSGGILNNYGLQINQPNGSGAGTTNNYGIQITGAGGGSTNWSLYNASPADSYYAGNILVGTLTNANSYALNLVGTAAASTSVLTPALDALPAGALTIGASNATSIGIGNTASNITTTVNGTAIIKTSVTDSATAFQLQNAGGNTYFNGNSANQIITSKDLNIGTTLSGGAGRLFSDGFESGNFKQWTSGTTAAGSSTVTTDTTTVRNGKYSTKIINNNGSSTVSTDITGGTSAVMRGYVYVSSHTSGGADLLTLNNGTNSFTMYRDLATGKLTFWNGVTSTPSLGSTVMSTGSWHKLELALTVNATTGTATMYLDGVNVLTLSGLNTGSTNLSRFYIGDNSIGRAATAYYDDTAVDTVLTGDSASLNVADSLHVGGSSSFGGSAIIQTVVNSTNAFQVQNASGSVALSVDTTSLNSLVSNNSFESGTNGWVASGTAASIAQSSVEKYIGSSSLAFTTGTAAGNSARLTVGTALTTSKTYTLSFYGKTNTTFSTLSASYSPDGTAANETDCAVFTPSRSVLTTSWTRYTCTINTSSTASTASGYIAIKQSDATSRILYIDAVQIEAGSAITQGLIGNTGFEAGAVTGWTYQGTPGSRAQSAVDKYNGTNSLLITTNNTALDGAKYTTGNTNPTQLAINTAYTFSFRAKATGSAVSNLAVAYSRNGSTEVPCSLNSNAISTSVWAYYSCTITTDGSAPAAGAYIIIEQSTAAVQTWYVDDVQLTKSSFVALPALYKDSGISLNGVISSPVAIRNQSDSSTAFQIQNAAGTNLLSADTALGRISVGANGTATGQLYVSGQVPTVATGSIIGGTSPTGLYVQGKYAYLPNNGDNTFQIFNVSNPASPVAVNGAGTATNTGPSAISVQGKYAYITNNSANTLQIFDISNPASPAIMNGNGVTIGGPPTGLYVSGRYAYVITGSDLQIFDISNPTSPQATNVPSLVTGSTTTAIQVVGRYAYVSSLTGISAIDISNPSSPVVISTLAVGGGNLAQAIYVQGRYAYLVFSSTAYMQIIDISNPAAMVSGGSATTSANPTAIYVQGRYAYIAANSAAMQIFDVSNTASPTLVGTVATGAGPHSIVVQGRYAYVAGGTFMGIQIFDVGGTYTQQLEAGGIEAGTISTTNSVTIGNNADVRGSLQVGSGAEIQGGLSVIGTGTFTSETNSGTAFQFQNTAGSSALTIDTISLNTLVNNGSFEAGISGWVASGTGASLAQSSTQKYLGTKSLAFTTGTSVGGSARLTVGTALSASTTYTLSFYAKAGTAMNTISASYSPDGTTAKETDCAVFTPYSRAVTTTGWTRFTCTINTSSTAATASGFVAIKQSDTTSRILYIDGVQIEPGTAITNAVVANTGIESASAWTYYGVPGSAVQSNADKYNGTNSLLITTSANTLNGVKLVIGNTNPTQLVTNSTYVMSFWAKSSGTQVAGLQVTYARDGVTEFLCTGLNSQTISNSNWGYFSCNITTDGTAPAAGAFVAIVNTTGASRAWYVDDIQFTKTTFIGTPTAFNETSIAINGVVDSPTSFRNQADSTTAFQIQNASGINVLSVDTLNNQISIGSLGTPTGQLYLSGSAPTVTGTATVGSAPSSVVVQGKYAYTVQQTTVTFAISDISNPANPIPMSSIATTGTPRAVAVQGKYAYVTTSSSLQIFDISNPTNVTLVSTIAHGGDAQGIYVMGHYVYIANNSSSLLQTYDVSNPLLPILTGSVASSSPTNVFVQGRYAYVTEASAGNLHIFDLANPAIPVTTSTTPVGNGARGIYVQGKYAYIVSSTSGQLIIYDISTPAAPALMGSTYVGSTGYAVSVQGRFAYVVSSVSNLLSTIDISNPSAPAVVSSVGGLTTPQSLYVQGRYAYVTNFGGTTMSVIDLGGAYLQQLEAGSLDAATVNTTGNATFGNNVNISGGLQASKGAEINGGVGVTGTATFTSETNTAGAFEIQTASAATILSVDSTTTNLLTNPNFETGVSGWAALGGAGAPTKTTVPSETNLGVAALTYTTTGINQGVSTSSFTGTVPAGTYNISFYMMASVGLTQANLQVELNDGAAHTCIPTFYGTSATFITSALYRRVYCFVTTTSNLSSIKITQLDATARTNYIDGVQLEINPTSGLPSAYRVAGITINGVITSPLIIGANSATTNNLQVLNTNNGSVFRVDGVGSTVNIGNDIYAQGSIQYAGSATLTASGSSTTLTLNTGISGTVNLGNTNTATINIGGASLATTTIGGGNVAHQIDIGSAATSTSQLISIGANTITNGSRLILNGSVVTTTSGSSGVLIGSATADVNQVDLQLDTSSVFAEAASTCTTIVNQGALYYNSSSNAIRTCVAGGWEDVMTTAGLGLIMFGIVPDSGTTPGDMAGVNATDANDGPCKVYMGSVANSVRWTGCTLYAYGRKHTIAAQSTNYVTAITTTANAFQNLCIAAPGAQPSFLTASATETSTTMMTTPANWSIALPSICLATIKEIAGGSGIGSIYDTRVFTTSDKAAASINTLSNIGYAVRPSATVGVLAPVNATTDPFIGVLASYSGSISATAVNAIVVVGGQSYVKATTAAVNQYVVPTATAGYTTGSALVVAARTDIPYNLLGIAMTTANAPGTQCSVTANADTCRGSVLVNVNIR